MNIHVWIDKATRPILLKRDRYEAIQELTDHFEDHCGALIARGRTSEEAEREALGAMGDAEETGRLLRAAYRPVLSIVWLAGKWAMILSLIALTVVLLSRGAAIVPDSYGKSWLNEQLEQLFAHAESENVLMRGKAGETLRVGGIRIRAEKAVAGKEDRIGGLYCYISVLLRFDYPFWLALPPGGGSYLGAVGNRLDATDNLGRTYPNDNSIRMRDADSYMWTSSVENPSSGRSYYLYVNLICRGGTALDSLQYVDLNYDHAGTAFSVRVYLEENAS